VKPSPKQRAEAPKARVGRPPAENALTVQLQLKISQAAMARIQARAREELLTVAEWVRRELGAE
jgi:hypothetical protein